MVVMINAVLGSHSQSLSMCKTRAKQVQPDIFYFLIFESLFYSIKSLFFEELKMTPKNGFMTAIFASLLEIGVNLSFMLYSSVAYCESTDGNL